MFVVSVKFAVSWLTCEQAKTLMKTINNIIISRNKRNHKDANTQKYDM